MTEVVNGVKVADSLKEKYLTFFLDDQCFAVDIQYVVEIIGIQGITKVPKVPAYIYGITNLRGKIISIIDMRARFHKMPKEFDKETCIIVVDVNDMTVGLIVDGIDEVEDIPEDEISNPPHIEWDYSSNFLEGVFQRNGKVRLILDCDKVLNG